jgi:hypothetical protein
MNPPTLRTLTVALALTLSLPVALATGVTAPTAAPPILHQPIDWQPQHVLSVEQAAALPPLAAPSDEPTGPSVPELYTGIGTGSALLVGPTVGSIAYLCTAAFLFQDPATGTYYLATAGHCLVRDETETTPHSGYVDPDRTNNEIDICVEQCLDNALQFGTYVRLYTGMPGAPAGYNPVVFGQSGGVGTDFGLVRIPESLNHLLRPWMPQFGGPTGMAAGTSTGDRIVHYGHGTYCCPAVTGGLASRTPIDQGRVAISLGSNGQSFDYVAWSTGGDSGSGMSLAFPGTRGLQGSSAVGVLTHGLVTSGEGSGTLLPRGLAMVSGYQAAHAAALPATLSGLALVKGSDAICTAGCGAAAVPGIAITTPAAGSSMAPGTLAVSGSVDRDSGAVATPPLVADAHGPYAADVGTAVAITGSATGGSAPYTCAWSGAGVTFADAAQCATTVQSATAGAATLALTVTDHDGATATDTAAFTANALATGPTCTLDDAADATVPVPDYEITKLCTERTGGNFVMTLTLAGLSVDQRLKYLESPVNYEFYVNALDSYEVSHLLAVTTVYNYNDASGLTAATAAYDEGTGTVTLTIPLSEIGATPTTARADAIAAEAAGGKTTLAGSPAEGPSVIDSVPDSGSAPASRPVFGLPASPQAGPTDGVVGSVSGLAVGNGQETLDVDLAIGTADAAVPKVRGTPFTYQVEFVAKNNRAAGLTYEVAYTNDLVQLNGVVPTGQALVGTFVLYVLSAPDAQGLSAICPVAADMSHSSFDADTNTIHWKAPLSAFTHSNFPTRTEGCAAFATNGRGLQDGDVLTGITGEAAAQVGLVSFGAVTPTVTAPDYTVSVAAAPGSQEHVRIAVGSHVQDIAVDTSAAETASWSGALDLSGLSAGSYTLTATWIDADGTTQLATASRAFTVTGGTTTTSTSTSTTSGTGAGGSDTGSAGGSVNNVAPGLDTLSATPSIAVIGRDTQVGIAGTAHDDNGNQDIAGVTVTVTDPLGAAATPSATLTDDASDATALSFTAASAVDGTSPTGTYQVDTFATDASGAQSPVVSLTFTVLPPPAVDISYTGAASRLDFGSFDPGASNVVSTNQVAVRNELHEAKDFLFDMTDFTCTRGGIPVMGNAKVHLGHLDGAGAFVTDATLDYAQSTVDFGTLGDGGQVLVQMELLSVPTGIAGTCTASFGLYHV